MRDLLRQLAVLLAVGAAAALLLKLAEAYLGFPSSARFFGGAALMVLGGVLSSGASGAALFEKGQVRGLTESDMRRHVDVRHGNLAAGTRLIVVGAVVLLSEFFF